MNLMGKKVVLVVVNFLMILNIWRVSRVGVFFWNGIRMGNGCIIGMMILIFL